MGSNKSFLGGLAEDALGFGVSMLGGPLLAGVEAVGNVLHPSRGLSETERKRLEAVYGKDGKMDLDAIQIRENSWLSLGASRTIGNTINLQDVESYHNKDGTLSEQGLNLLAHESMHSWQYQNGGLGYIGDSLANQAREAVFGDGAEGAYEFNKQVVNGVPWNEWNAEQQADCVQQWDKMRQTAADPHVSADKRMQAQSEADCLQQYVDKVRAGEGAAEFGMNDITG